MTLTPAQHGPFVRGVDASSGIFQQPKGTVPRSSDLIGIARGALCTSDGSSILAWEAAAIQSGFAKFISLGVFQPSGVQPYYLALITGLIPLGQPFNLSTSDQGAGGSLIPGHTYVYTVTAIDGTGGESILSTTASFVQPGVSHIVKLSWAGMPNAFAYNVYRLDITVGGPFLLLSSPSLPVPQSPSLSFNFNDNGSAIASTVPVPVADTTSQTALIKIPASSTPPATWTPALNTVALFPAAIKKLSIPAVAGNASTSPTGNVPIVASPSGLIPLSNSIAIIQGNRAGYPAGTTYIELSPGDSFPPDLQPGDNLTVSGTSGYNTTYVIIAIGPNGTNLSSDAILLSGAPSSGLELAGAIQYSLVSLSTVSSFFPDIGSTQTISFADNGGYDGSCVVRSGGGNSFVVYSPGASVLPPSGGGTFGGASTPPGVPTSGPAYSTVNGGIIGLVSPVPQMVQFTNRMILALGNGIPPYYYPDDTGTSVNPAVLSTISGITVISSSFPASGISITVTTSVAHGLSVGGSVVIVGVTPASFNGVAVVNNVISPTSFTAWLPGTFPSLPVYSGGGATIQSAQPLPNNYTVAYPQWIASTTVVVGTVWVPLTQPSNANVFLVAIAAGETGTVEPTWFNPAATGQAFPTGNITDGTVVWQEGGYLTSPPVPGAAHVAVYANCLFFLNTSPTNTANGLDGPTVIRQSDPGNPFSWNPAFQSFLDKDDGSEGMGLAVYTIAAAGGIPPEGSLFAFKNYSSFQILGIFGAANFEIQRIRTERGCSAPRTILFMPGFGITRLTHLGLSVTDGVDDRLLSDPIRPFLFSVNDSVTHDITPADPSWLPLACSALTANPPMYNCFIPVGFNGESGGALTRSLSFDLVQKAWYPINFPFSIGTVTQALLTGLPPVTLFGGFQDGLIQRWQFGDQLWLVGSGSPSQVAWSYRTPVTASKSPDQRLFCQEISLKGTATHSLGPITCVVTVDGVTQPAVVLTPSLSGDFLLVFPVQATGNRFYADISGTGGVEIDGDDFHVVPKKVGGRLVVA